MKKIVALAALAGTVSFASAQAITGFTGGSQFGSFFGGALADTVGWRFSVNQDIFVTHLGVWNADTQGGSEGLTSSHQIGVWDLSTGALLGSGFAGPGGLVVGQWTYADTSDFTLTVGGTYVIGATYTATDGDSYISSATSLTTSADVNHLGGHAPVAADLGFALPTTFSGATSRGRFGPNFLYTPVPTPGAAAVLALAGVAAARRRR